LKGHRKLRVGDYRVIFRIEGTVVLVLAILHRSVIYQRARTRLSHE
jgi:mRNA interferase RelE/StbE